MSVLSLSALGLLAGCHTLPPGAEAGPHGTMAYDVLVDATPPGARVHANGADMGTTPLHLKIFGDTDGTFHDFGSPYYIIQAMPLNTNQFTQVRVFGTGQMFGPEDRIPTEIHFDMDRKPPPSPPNVPPGYTYPYPYPYPYPYYWGYPYWGPYYYGPHYYYHRHW
jgi:hypothetical protein